MNLKLFLVGVGEFNFKVSAWNLIYCYTFSLLRLALRRHCIWFGSI